MEKDKLVKVVTVKDVKGTSIEIGLGASDAKSLVASSNSFLADYLQKHSQYSYDIASQFAELEQQIDDIASKQVTADNKKALQDISNKMLSINDKLFDQSEILNYISSPNTQKTRKKE